GGGGATPDGGGAVPGGLALRAGRAGPPLRRGAGPPHPRASARLGAGSAAHVRACPQEAHHRVLPAAAAAPIPQEARRAIRAGLLHPHLRPRPLRRSSPERPHAAASGGAHPSATGHERSAVSVGRPREHHLRGRPVSVSLVIATFNHGRFLAAALDSAVTQTVRGVEIIVVDDGSTDATPAVLARYAGRIRVVRQPNRGLAAARNAGLAAAHGAYVSFLDADDVMMPTKLAEQVAVLDRAPSVGWTYCDVLIETVATGAQTRASERFGYGARMLEGWLFPELIHGNFIPAIAPLVRRTVLDAVGGFDERLTALEDWDLWLRMSLIAEARYSQAVLVRYRIHPGGMSED